MSNQVITAAERYKLGLAELELMVRATEQEVVAGNNSSPLLTSNINFFTKSFLISLCAHIEMCVKEIVFVIAKDIDERAKAASIPPALIEWRYGVKKKPDVPNNLSLEIGMTRKEVDDLVSGNVYRTKEALACVGIDLAKDKVNWETWKELIQTIVKRRNNIVHHDDDASDLSLGDVRKYIESAQGYIDFIVTACR
ncbi:HEPN domain-containing protein [Xanthomonas arboricola]|uniref:HEPN domain-containing protein n=1 Tax=Xanthomonas arboricola TaxID=56448 RepID=UPI0011AFFFE7|nr:HEPN domain-containing protein [Xanthomonas arboricola]